MSANQTCTYCGKTGHQAHACPIRKREAHDVLDAARAGLPTPWHRITEALHATGDLSTVAPVAAGPVAYWEAA